MSLKYKIFKNRKLVYVVGEGKIKLPGNHDIELDATYRITYRSRTRNVASIIISIEKIDG